jgi:hypothetical protein
VRAQRRRAGRPGVDPVHGLGDLILVDVAGRVIDREPTARGDSAVSWAAYGVMVWSCGATAITPLIAALLALIAERMFSPVVPPPAAATACAASFGGVEGPRTTLGRCAS